MKIAVVTRMLRKDKLEGFGVFTHEILSRIVKDHPEHEYLFLFDRNFDRRFLYSEKVKPFILLPPASRPWLLVFWYQYRLKWFLKMHKPDLLISPDGGIPVDTKVKTLSVIHDLNFEHYPEDLPEGVRNYYRNTYRKIANAATRLVTVSHFSKKDLEQTYGIDEGKTDVVYNGAGAQFSPLDPNSIATVRKQYAEGQPYFLFVGSIHQRKNLPNMMKAFTAFRERHQEKYKFIMAGAKRWWNQEMEDAFEKSPYQRDIVFTGRVADDALPALTAAATALLFVSRFEGFGIPIIEAMKCGVPVITSTTTSMPEVAGGAGLLADPDDVQGICNAMLSIASDAKLRHDLSVKGMERAKLFSWDQSAQLFWKSIEKTVS